MAKFGIFSERKQNSDHEYYDAFGIAVSERGETVGIVRDVCADKEKLTDFITLLNSERLDPIHLDEAIENFLYDFEA